MFPVNQSNFHTHEIQLEQIYRNYIIITMEKSECTVAFNNTIIIDASYGAHSKKTNKNRELKPSGAIVLCIAVIESRSKDHTNTWGEEEIHTLTQWKPNIVTKTTQHFGSSGLIYSFGNRGNFGMIDNSSITTYANRKFKNKAKHSNAQIDADRMEYLCADEVRNAVASISKLVPNISMLLSPIIRKAFDMQSRISSIDLKDVKSVASGVWQSEVCVNSKTAILHTEEDVTYTLITVPKQCRIGNLKESQNRTYFIFQINPKNNIAIHMNMKLSFLFSGKFLTHRQHCNATTDQNNRQFVNIACYGNKMLYSHIKASISRTMNDKNITK